MNDSEAPLKDGAFFALFIDIQYIIILNQHMMRPIEFNIRSLPLVILMICLAGKSSYGANIGDTILPPPTLEFSIDKFVEKVSDYFHDPNNQVSGYQFVINKDGQLYYSESGGNAIYAADNNGVNVPMTNSTRHHVASVSKTICTITLANVLEDEGIDWDEPIASYLPSEWQGLLAPDHSDPFSPCYLTFEKLVTHQSCIGFTTSDSGPYPNANAMALFIGSDSLDMNPGSGLGDYQNGNFVLARMLISEIVGEFFLPDPTDSDYDKQSADLY
ncbi:MAG: beta-lactamase family protein, partial [Flavobacteriales bacterium]|nr:beta-lactamase family protein [Flavobacteriales bacterium]